MFIIIFLYLQRIATENQQNSRNYHNLYIVYISYTAFSPLAGLSEQESTNLSLVASPGLG